MPSWKKPLGEFENRNYLRHSLQKYDRALKGDAELTALEAEGKALFFDKTRTLIVVTAINQVKRIQQRNLYELPLFQYRRTKQSRIN